MQSVSRTKNIRMLKWLGIILCLLSVNHAMACLSASQHRLFPLGRISTGLCVVETHLYRTEFRDSNKVIDEFRPAWRGISYFKIYDADYKEVFSETLDTIKLFKQKLYDSIVQCSFLKGMQRAKLYPGFVAARPVSITFCDYQEQCGTTALLYDSIQNTIRVKLRSKSYDVKVLFDSTSIASNILSYYGGYDDNNPLTAMSFKGYLYINSIRRFEIGNKTLTVVHLGSGQHFERVDGGTYPPGKEYKPSFAFNDINKSVFEEPVLHHGHGFDFYIWE